MTSYLRRLLASGVFLHFIHFFLDIMTFCLSCGVKGNKHPGFALGPRTPQIQQRGFPRGGLRVESYDKYCLGLHTASCRSSLFVLFFPHQTLEMKCFTRVTGLIDKTAPVALILVQNWDNTNLFT